MRGDAQSLVSVIVPIYNVETYLDQCLDSISAQTYRNLEVICINDGSTDGSLAIMQRHASVDGRIRIIDKPNGGYGQGCNRGIDEARGAWISIIEPDDWIEPHMYESMLAFADSFDVPIDIVKTPWYDVCDWNDPEKQTEAPCPLVGLLKTSKRPFAIEDHPELLEFHPATWSAIYRREFLVQNTIRLIEYPGAGWADNPFLAETMGRARAIVYLDEAFYHYRTDLPGSTGNHATDDAIVRPFDRWDVMLDILERCGKTQPEVLEAHYMRGFNYVQGAIFDDGWDNPLVKERTRAMFLKMDPQIVMGMPTLNPRRKQFFFEVIGKPVDRIPFSWRRLAYMVDEVRHQIVMHGVIGFFRRRFGGGQKQIHALPY